MELIHLLECLLADLQQLKSTYQSSNVQLIYRVAEYKLRIPPSAFLSLLSAFSYLFLDKAISFFL